ncbi:Basic helix-loop-helix DNA-binding superfamily protein, putative isoform 1 [Theobroma cacao]|uniref:Basic helix-loop-helix DNA-binding superfamily protein, putative isoform 1 n=1 Tax=Theobroma cacao TaxID=3641 RepID=A0A061GF20_THECC|nr:Basic helix-loop-helix DNA-binding superfamily protein, putative isoform 1 [Theobroma cacao]
MFRMAAYSFNNNFSSGNCYSGLFNPLSRDMGPRNGSSHGGSLSVLVSQTLVLDSEKGELVKAPVKVGKKSVSEEKVIAALKSHSEAEKRRRERINAHLDTLRGLLPCREKRALMAKVAFSHGIVLIICCPPREKKENEAKFTERKEEDSLYVWICSMLTKLEMDKATLLGEVIRQVKELKKNATEASKGFLVPMDDDEVRVEPCEDEANGILLFKASICCDYRPELLTDLRRALDALPIKMVKAETSTLGSRLKNDFVFAGCRTAHADEAEARRFLACSIHQALNSVLEKASASPEYSPSSIFPNKRRRMSHFDSSSSSS